VKGKVLIILLLVAILAFILLGRGDWKTRQNETDMNETGTNVTDKGNNDINETHHNESVYNITYYGDGELMIAFEVKVPPPTPAEDRIFLRIDGFWYEKGSGGLPMVRVDDHTWAVGYMAGSNSAVRYKYNRNNYGFATDEEFDPDDEDTWRSVATGNEAELVSDVVSKWRWISSEPIQVTMPTYIPDEAMEQTFVMGVFPLDFYDPAFTTYVPATLDRIAEMGIDYVGIAYAPSFFTGSDPLTFTRDPLNTYTLEELEYAINLARDRELKILLAPGIETDPSDLEGIEAGFSISHTDEWYAELAREWNDSMVETAIFAEDHGVEILTPSNQWPFWGNRTPEQDEMLNELINAAFHSIRSVYSGVISSDFYVESDNFDYYAQMDWIGDKWWWALSDDRATDLDDMVARAEQIVHQQYEPIHEKYDKPIFLQQIAYSSYDGAAGGLQVNTEGPEVGEWFPYNPLYPADFQEQVDAYEAVFRAIYDEPIFAGACSFSYTYWDTQDKSTGIRGKPAEDVWARWAGIFGSE
jgi:hypothetical protein